MSRDAYYRETPLEKAVVEVLNAVLPTGYTASRPDDKALAAGLAVVEVINPTPRNVSMLGGPSYATADLQVSCLGRNRAHAREFGGLVRQILTERRWSGEFINPVRWDGGRVDEIVATNGFLDTDKGVNTWVQALSASYQAANTPVLPSS